MTWVIRPTTDGPLCGVDIDGVLCDYVAGLRSHLEGRWGRKLQPAASWRLREWFAEDSERVAAHLDAVRSGLWTSAPPISGAVDGVRRLRELGWLVVAVSARGSYGESAVELAATQSWLSANSINVDGLWLGRPKSDSGCSVYVDDSPKEVEGLLASHKRVVVLSQPWNMDLQGVDRAMSWLEVVDCVGPAEMLGPTC